MSRIGCTAVLLGVVLFSVGCDKDVTNDPRYAFTGVVGTWKAKVPLRLEKPGNDPFLVTATDSSPAVATLPAGTQLRIEHLIRYATEAGDFTRVTGMITSGPHAGEVVSFASDLFAPNPFTDPQRSPKDLPKGWTFTWKVDPDKLEK